MKPCKYCGEEPCLMEDPDHSTAYIISHDCRGVTNAIWLWGQWKELVVNEWGRENE